MKLIHLVQEASKTSDVPRLNRRAAVNVIRVIAEWLDLQHGRHGGDPTCSRLDVARDLRNETK